MQELVIFDLDNTLIKGQSQLALLKYAKKKGLISPYLYFKIFFWFVLYKIGLAKNPRKIMEYAFNFIKGKRKEELELIIKDFCRTNLYKHIFEEGRILIREHKGKGRKIILVSNAIDYILKYICNYLEADFFIGTKLVLQNGEFTGKINGDIIYGENKVFTLNEFFEKEGFSWRGSYCYTDHHSDVPLLKMAEFPVVINPTPKLLKEAKKRNWPILNFKNTIG